MKLWLNGALLAPEAARIAPGDRGFTLGDGLFETLRIAGGTPQRIGAHLARLAAGAEVIGLPLPPVDFAAAFAAVIAANGLTEGSARLTVTRGAGPRGVMPPAVPSPTMLITVAPAAGPAAPARLITATVTRRNELSPLSQVKSLNYLDNILARQEAARRDADEAVLLNTQGRVAETSFSNLFVVAGGRLLTPPVSEGALPGVTRAGILALGAEEQPLTLADLAQAQEIFLTTSLGIRSVATFEGRVLSACTVADRIRGQIF